MLVVGGLLMLWRRIGSSPAAFAAAAVAARPVFDCVHSFSDLVLGGSPTSASLFFTLAVVAAGLGFADREPHSSDRTAAQGSLVMDSGAGKPLGG